jgi:protein-tyrosine phosphatase
MAPPRLYWVDAPTIGRIAVVSRPREARHFAELKAAGVDVLASMLEAEEAASVGLGDQADHCAAAGIEFFNLAILDHGIPDAVEPVEALVQTLLQRLAAGKGVAAHCFAGLGRSPLIVASVLIRQGIASYDACDLISAARGHDVPEMSTQVEWLLDFEMRHTEE